MKVVFVSTMCSRPMYEAICRKRKMQLLDSSQKFFEMLVNGLKQLPDVSVECVCVRPVSRGTYPEHYLSGQQENVEQVTYHYPAMVNFPVLQTMSARQGLMRIIGEVLRRSQEETVLIADPLNLECAQAAIACGKRYGVKTVGFLTDLPDYAAEADRMGRIKAMMYRFYNRQLNRQLWRFDRYVFLTKYMAEYVNNGKPWLLMECLVDDRFYLDRSESRQAAAPSVLYAGKLHGEFGLDLLAQAIPLVKHGCSFDFYGDGNYRETLTALAEQDARVHVHGIVPVKEVIRREQQSTLLINPRTSKGEFTKYSFPSKTAEYMMTGVPVVMFKLPGIPDEYDDYLFYPQRETPEALAQEIDRILEMDEQTRAAIGQRAARFVREEKSNRSQAQRLIRFISET